MDPLLAHGGGPLHRGGIFFRPGSLLPPGRPDRHHRLQPSRHPDRGLDESGLARRPSGHPGSGQPARAPAPGPASWPPASAFNAVIDPLPLRHSRRHLVPGRGRRRARRGLCRALSGDDPRVARALRPGRSFRSSGSSSKSRIAPAEAGGEARWAPLREAQSKALSVPMTGEAVALDLGQAVATSPGGLREIGRRLALLAKAKVYSIPVDFSGPLYSGIEKEGAALRVNFTFAGDGLTAADRPLQSFEVAGPDRVFHAAKAAIEGDAVSVVQSAAVKRAGGGALCLAGRAIRQPLQRRRPSGGPVSQRRLVRGAGSTVPVDLTQGLAGRIAGACHLEGIRRRCWRQVACHQRRGQRFPGGEREGPSDTLLSTEAMSAPTTRPGWRRPRSWLLQARFEAR